MESNRDRTPVRAGPEAGGSEEFGYKQELKRVLSFWDLLIYGLVFMVPIAPMGIYGVVASISNGMVPLAYLIGMVGMVFTALSYARMAAAFPIAGSVYSYAQRGINPHIGFLAGWAILLDYLLVPALVYLVSGLWLAEMIPSVPYWAWIIFFVALNTVVNFRGIEMTARTNLVLFAVEMVALVAFVVMAAVTVAKTGTGFSLRPLWDPQGFSLQMVMTATSVAVLSYLGFDAISTLAEETKDPRRMVGRATVASLLLIGALFMLQTYLAGLVWPDYTTFPNVDVAFYYIAERAGGAWLRVLTLLATVLAWGVGDGLVAQAAISRLLYSMSRDEMLPRFLSRIHPRYRTPYASIFLSAALAIVIGTLLDLETLSSLVNFGALTGFLFLHWSVFNHYVLRQGRRDAASLFNYALLPAAGFLIVGYVWLSLQSAAKTMGFVWTGIGLVVLLAVTRGLRRVPPVFREMGG